MKALAGFRIFTLLVAILGMIGLGCSDSAPTPADSGEEPTPESIAENPDNSLPTDTGEQNDPDFDPTQLVCEGDPSSGDSDLDGICDDQDPCYGDNESGDDDQDGICNNVDLCEGTDDPDMDGKCGDDDPCPLDSPDDVDGDGVCSSDDQCPNMNPDDLNQNGVGDCLETENGTGESCNSPYVMNHFEELTHNVFAEGSGFNMAQFDESLADDHNWSETAGCTPGDNWDLDGVIEMHMTTSQTLHGRVTGKQKPIMIRILKGCEPETAACVANYQTGSDDWQTSENEASVLINFTPTEDGTYYFVIERDKSAEPDTYVDNAYWFNLSIIDHTESSCNDGIDNDNDGWFDCMDDECFAECGVETLFHEPFDAASNLDVTLETNTWSWDDVSNNTNSPSGGGYAHYDDVVELGTYGMELDLSDVDFSAYSNYFLVFWHKVDNMPGMYFDFLVEISYDDGATWNELYTQYAFDHRFGDGGGEAEEITGSMMSRDNPRLRFSVRDTKCGGAYHNCLVADFDWTIDDIKILAYGEPGSDIVSGHISSVPSIFISQEATQNTEIDPALPDHGDGETCDSPFVIGPLEEHGVAGDDIANRTENTNGGCGPNSDGYNTDHDWSSNDGCTFPISYYDASYLGADLVWALSLKKGEIILGSNQSNIDGGFYVLEGGCYPSDEPSCIQVTHTEFQSILEYKAPSDGIYHVVFKTSSPDPCQGSGMFNSTVAYNIEVGHYMPYELNCSDGMDNDGNGVADCEDPACFQLCERHVLFSEYFTDSLPPMFASIGAYEDEWRWCSGDMDCPTYKYVWGPVLEDIKFSQSGGGHALMKELWYGGTPTLATPVIGVSHKQGEHLGLAFSLKHTTRYKTMDPPHVMYLEVMINGQMVIGRSMSNEISYDSMARGTKFVDLSQWADGAETIRAQWVVDNYGLKSNDWRLDDVMVVSW